MPVDAFIYFEKATSAMADVKGESLDPSFKEYFSTEEAGWDDGGAQELVVEPDDEPGRVRNRSCTAPRMVTVP